MALAVLLSGDPTTFPRAEAEAMLKPEQWIGDRVALCPESDEPAVRRLAYGRMIGTYWGDAEDTPEGHAELADLVRKHAPGKGKAAVQTYRTGEQKSPNSQKVERQLGGALSDAGHPIDLQHPEFVVFGWFHAGRVIIGHLHAALEHDYERRTVSNRAHFSPVSLHPRLALALVHLTGCQPGERLHDPFCGTGGLILEAALDGYEASGSDLDPWMAAGTLSTLADEGPEPLEAMAFVADVAETPNLLGPESLDGIISDLPYGGASSTNNEALSSLYDRAFAAFAALLPPGRRVVFGCHDEALGRQIERAGFHVEAIHEQYVHRSMTRRFFVALRSDH